MERDYTLSTKLIISEARKRGIKVNSISKDSGCVEFIYKKHKEYLRGQVTSNNSAISVDVLGNKKLTRLFLAKSKINVPQGRAFTKGESKEALLFAQKIGFPLVIKPTSGTHGHLVFVNVKNKQEAKKIISKILKEKDSLLVEEYFQGQEYRIFATRKKFVSAVNRVPANIIGDGQNTIEELIKIKNSDPRRGKGYEKALLKINIDEEVKRILKQQKVTLKSIPSKNKIVYLRINSNLSTGGDSYEVSHLVHPSIKKLAIQCVQAVPGLQYTGLDLLTKDITKKQTKKTYAVIEMNHSPMISMHHFPYQGKSKNPAKEIIDLLFPETKGRLK